MLHKCWVKRHAFSYHWMVYNEVPVSFREMWPVGRILERRWWKIMYEHIDPIEHVMPIVKQAAIASGMMAWRSKLHRSLQFFFHWKLKKGMPLDSSHLLSMRKVCHGSQPIIWYENKLCKLEIYSNFIHGNEIQSCK